MLAQYPLAKKVIMKLLEEQYKLPISRLPYQRRSAAVFAQLYASATPEVEYDDTEEVLIRKREIA